MNLHVRYRLISNRSEDQGRLIATSTEAFVANCASITNTIAPSVVSESEAALIWVELRPQIESLIKSDYFKSKRSKERTAITDKITYFFEKDIFFPALDRKVRHLIKASPCGREWLEQHLYPRLKGFADTRNELAHKGKYKNMHTDSWTIDYFQLVMIMPLVFFALIGYTGPYNDLEKLQREFIDSKKDK